MSLSSHNWQHVLTESSDAPIITCLRKNPNNDKLTCCSAHHSFRTHHATWNIYKRRGSGSKTSLDQQRKTQDHETASRRRVPESGHAGSRTQHSLRDEAERFTGHVSTNCAEHTCHPCSLSARPCDDTNIVQESSTSVSKQSSRIENLEKRPQGLYRSRL